MSPGRKFARFEATVVDFFQHECLFRFKIQCLQSIHRIKPRFGVWLKAWQNQTNQNISIRYEESQLHDSIYQLHVKLLGADRCTVISEYTSSPTEDRSRYSRAWKEVSLLPTSSHIRSLHALCNFSYFLCLLAGVSCVLQVRTRSEICPLPTPTEEHVLEWLLQNHVRQQHCGGQTK